MAQNPLQFQKGLSLPDFLKEYGTEEQDVYKRQSQHGSGLVTAAGMRVGV